MPNITKSLVERLQPKDKDYIIWDDALKGFGIKVTPKGKKSYLLKYVGAGGKQRKPSLGVHGGKTTCEKARAKAKEMLLQITDKVDPMTDREKSKAELTFSELFEAYIERHAKLHKKTWKFNQEYYDRHISHIIGDEQLSLITREQMQRLHMKLAKTSGQSMANQVIALITTVYNKAIEWGYFEGIPPTKYVKKFKEKPRDRFLQRDELPKFFEALNQEENLDFRDFILMLIFTGQRKSNVLSMRWQDMRLDQGYWYIPETKNGEPAMVPLVNEALEIINERQKNAENEWVFHGSGSTGHLVEPKKAWKRLLERSGIENLTMHDLRRTMGSWQTINGSSPFIVAKSLGHKSLKSTQIYARLNIDPVRASMNDAVKTMMEG